MFELLQSTKKQIDHWLKKYPIDQRRSAIVASLLAAQEQNHGHLTDEAMNAVADYLKIIGKHKICVCTNISCMLRGSDKIIDYLKNRLKIDVNETTADGKFTLREVECLAACCGAPMCQIDDKKYHENLTPEKMGEILDELL